MHLSLNKAHYPVTVLGPGRRIGIWFQGCSIHCPGCVSQDTWEADAGRRMKVGELISWCREVSRGKPDGITISGGEPFEQPAALSNLLDGLMRWREKSGLDFDILCYSGYPISTLENKHPAILAKLDALIPEPFVGTLPMDRLWRGSANQGLVPLSDRGRARYTAYLEAPADTFGKRMQVAVDAGRAWYVGLPARGDMEALEELCRQRGLEFTATSWSKP